MDARELIQALYDNVTFPPGIASKRFVRDMVARPADAAISERAERYTWRIAYIYRRQLPQKIAFEAISRKRDHIWTNIGGHKFLLECEVCKQQAYHKGSRNLNAPCPGPPEPKPIKTPRKKECSGTRGAVAVAKSPIVAPQESLFDAEAAQ
jgi:hypothetical protein